MRDRGGRLIVVDPRLTPIARNADLYLPVRPGGDTALFMAILHVILRDHLENAEFLAAHTTGFDAVAASVEAWTPERAATITGVPPASVETAAHWIAEARTAMGLHARGIEHHSHGVENCLSMLNVFLATGHMGREGAGCMMITGQGNGQGGREHGQKADQLPGQRSITDPAAREHVARVWGIRPEEIPGPGLSAQEIMNAIHAGEIKGLLSICFNPLVSLPDAAFTREALDKLEFFGVVDFFLSETAQHADVVLAGSLQEEDEGVVANVEGRVLHIRQCVPPPGNARQDWRIYCDLAARLGHADKFAYQTSRDIFDELRVASKGGPADYSGITYEKIDAQMGVCWPCPTDDHPGTPRLFEGGRFFHPDGRAHLQVTEVRPGGDDPDAAFPIHLTTGRVVNQYLSGTQTRRIGGLIDAYSEPKVEIHPRLAEELGIVKGDWVTVTTRRTEITVQALIVRTIRPDTVFIPYHWPGSKSANLLTHRTLDPRSKIPEYKSSACRLRKAEGPPPWATAGTRASAAPARCRRTDVRLRVLRRPVAVHRVPRLRGRLRRVRDPSRRADDQRRLHRPQPRHRDGAHRVHALRQPDLRAGLPRGRDQEDRGRRRAVRAEAAMHRLRQLRRGLPLRRAQGDGQAAADDEVRHVLRPHFRGQEADVRDRLPLGRAQLREARGDRAPARAPGQHVPLREPDRDDQGVHDGPGEASKRSRSTWPTTCGSPDERPR